VDDLPNDVAITLGDRYRIDRELGGGGMALVFVAREIALEREVVIKVLSPDVAGELSHDRFQREIRFAATLQQANIVPLLSTGKTVGGLPYYIMPFVEGDSLRARLLAGPIAAETGLSVLRDVARAMEYAHDQGVVHRDLKPENVLLSGGTAVVADFGIAKAVSASKAGGASGGGTLTSFGTTIGTPAYMSPEQAVGGDVDARSDIYAWGVIAYEVLGGKHPFAKHRTAQQLVTAHLAEAPVSLSASRSAISPAVASLVMRALAKDPTDRPQHARELIDVLARNAGHASPFAPSSLRGVVVGAAVVVGVVIAGSFALRARGVGPTPPPPAAADAPIIAVLPFESVGTGVDSAFAAGLTDAITSKLSRVAGIRVIDQRSIISAGQRGDSPQGIGRQLRAAFVLGARVLWRRDAKGRPSATLTATLIRVVDGATVWQSDPELVPLGDPFDTQARLATRVVSELHVALAPAERIRIALAATRDTAAYAAYVRGWQLTREAKATSNVPNLRRGLFLYESAYKQDPKYADALGGASDMLVLLGEAAHNPALTDSAENVALRALAIDPNQPDAVSTASWFLQKRGEGERAREMVRRAADANPSNVELLHLDATVNSFFGDSARGLSQVERFISLAPRSVDALAHAIELLTKYRRYQEASDLVGRALDLDSTRLDLWSLRVELMDKAGDRASVARAVRDYRAHGGQLTASRTHWLRHGDAGLRRELANATLDSYGTNTRNDTLYLLDQMMQLAIEEKNAPRAAAFADSGSAMVRRGQTAGADATFFRRIDSKWEALFAAYRGDAKNALRALSASADSAMVRAHPASWDAVGYRCRSAEVFGMLGSVDDMIPALRACLSLPSGFPTQYLHTQPALSVHLAKPRVKALDVAATTVRLNAP
jgi:TolB-like protein/tetratricopeptide (TPR) repeat protein